jgi:uncharacterized alkaline shock family protein YloU
MKFCTEYGQVTVSLDVFRSLAGHAAMRCFGVKGMAARSVADGFFGLLKREHVARGVKITMHPEKCEIGVDLHIVVEYGVNIPVVTRSIMSEVRYILEKHTGVRVGAMSVFIDALMPDNGVPAKKEAKKRAQPPKGGK